MVKDYILQLEELTLNVVKEIDQIGYEELALFSDRREELASFILESREPLNDLDRERLQSLRQYDKAILSRMEYFKVEASDWLLKRKNIKTQASAYNVGYTPDSMFFDHKK